jgi:phosphoribosylglycinamide formyltransferase-1
MSLSLAVLVSGSGSNLQSIIDKIEAGALDARLELVFSNKPDAYGLERAKKHGVMAKAASHKDFPSREAFDRHMIQLIQDAGAEAVALAGFMRILSQPFLDAFPQRVLNIHPALLPSFAGAHGQGDAAEYGVKLSGCTVHFVDELMDHGPIIVQAAVPALPNEGREALAARILAMEHRVYPQALQWLATGRLRIEGRHVRLLDPASPARSAPLSSTALVNPPLEEGF